MKKSILFFLLLAFGQANATLHVIEVEDNQFNPANITVSVGDTIFWSRDIGNVSPHSVTSGVIPDSADVFDVTIDMQTPNFTYKVDLPGTYDYVCTFHTGMEGRINATWPTAVPKVSTTFLKVVNPVRNGQLMFFYELKKPATANVILTDMQGAKIVEISAGMRSAGLHLEEYNLPILPKGMYLLQLRIDAETVTRQVML